MSEMIDGYQAKLIKDFWMNPGSISYSQHSLCKGYTEHLEKQISEQKELIKELVKALEYCAVEPELLRPENNRQCAVAMNALFKAKKHLGIEK